MKEKQMCFLYTSCDEPTWWKIKSPATLAHYRTIFLLDAEWIYGAEPLLTWWVSGECCALQKQLSKY